MPYFTSNIEVLESAIDLVSQIDAVAAQVGKHPEFTKNRERVWTVYFITNKFVEPQLKSLAQRNPGKLWWHEPATPHIYTHNTVREAMYHSFPMGGEDLTDFIAGLRKNAHTFYLTYIKIFESDIELASQIGVKEAYVHPDSSYYRNERVRTVYFVTKADISSKLMNLAQENPGKIWFDPILNNYLYKSLEEVEASMFPNYTRYLLPAFISHLRAWEAKRR